MNLRAHAVLIGLLALGAPASAAPIDISGLRGPVACSGSEPFWGLTIHDTKHATYIWDNQPTQWKVLEVGHASGRPTTWHIRFAGKNRQAFIFDEGQHSCSDSDSDEPSEYGLLLQDGDALYRGCCSQAPY